MSGFKLPGVVWSALLVALPLLSVWLEQYFSGAIWAAPVAGLLLIVAKVVGVVQGGEQPATSEQSVTSGPRPAMSAAPPAAAGETKAARLLWG